MILTSYIQNLLYRYDCVIVPGFGGFISHRITATIEGDVIYPPSKRISFNTHLTHNDGLLANHIAAVEETSYHSANNKIHKAVSVWKEQLQKNALVLEGVGTLTLNTENQLCFEPNQQINYELNSFGLTQVTNIEKEVVTSSLKGKTKVLVPNSSTNDSPKEKSLPYAFMKYAAGAAILVAGVVASSIYGENNRIQDLAKTQSAIEQKIQKATFIIEDQLPAVSLNITKESKKIYIIAGAFELEKNAKKKMKDAIRKGYDAQLLGKNQWGLTQVSVGSFSTKEAADEVINEIRDQISEDAWILVQKN